MLVSHSHNVSRSKIAPWLPSLHHKFCCKIFNFWGNISILQCELKSFSQCYLFHPGMLNLRHVGLGMHSKGSFHLFAIKEKFSTFNVVHLKKIYNIFSVTKHRMQVFPDFLLKVSIITDHQLDRIVYVKNVRNRVELVFIYLVSKVLGYSTKLPQLDY